MADYAGQVKYILGQNGCYLKRQGKGDHEIWFSPSWHVGPRDAVAAKAFMADGAVIAVPHSGTAGIAPPFVRVVAGDHASLGPDLTLDALINITVGVTIQTIGVLHCTSPQKRTASWGYEIYAGEGRMLRAR